MAPDDRMTSLRRADGGKSTSKLWLAAVAVWRKMSRLIQTMLSPGRSLAGSGPNFILSMTTTWVCGAAATGGGSSSDAAVDAISARSSRARIGLFENRRCLLRVRLVLAEQ